jgi:cytochrome c-type biogenesis protein CcmH/NrfG
LSLAEYHERQNDMMAAQSALKQAARINPQHPKLIDMQIAFNKRLTM